MIKSLNFRAKLSYILATIFFLAIAQISQSQSITIDSSFNGIGRLNTDHYDSLDYRNFRRMYNIAVQSDGKVVLVGNKTDSLLVFRYKPNGTMDSSFGNNGITAVSMIDHQVKPMQIRVLPNGNILILAQENATDKYVLYRYLPNGLLDKDYGQQGKTKLELPTPGAVIGLMELQTDGKVLLAGNAPGSSASWPGFYMARFNPNGSIDGSFGQAGEVKSYFNFIPSNELNGAFYSGGTGIVDFAIQPDGKIVACGTLSARWNGYIISDSIVIVRYNPDGSFDQTFSVDGKFSYDYPNPDNPRSSGSRARSVCLEPNGKIIVAGGLHSSQSHGVWRYSRYVVLRVLPNGMRDSTFDNDGVKLFPEAGYTEFSETLIQADEKILLVGVDGDANPSLGTVPEFVMARLNKDGTLDDRFGPGGFWASPYYNNTDQKMIRAAYRTVMKDQRMYIFGLLPNNNDEGAWGSTLFVFKMDAVAANPKTNTLCGQGTATTIVSDLKGNTYQWQVSTDSTNFTNVNNDAHYSGVNSSSLSIKEIPLPWNGYKYRCVTEKSSSNVTTIQFLNANENEWTGAKDNAWENPANWLCGTVPDTNSIVFIPEGKVKIHSNVTVKELHLRPGATLVVDPGYSVVLNSGSQ